MNSQHTNRPVAENAQTMNTPARRPPQAHAPHLFSTASGQLLIGGIPLERLAARVGQTPFYAYDRALLDSRVAELRAGLPAAVRLHYAMKANPMPALVCHMASQVDGIDVASAGELRIALDTGIDPLEISFAGPGKRRAELIQAVAAGILINIESVREIDELASISDETGLPARVAVRVNPDFELKSSGMKMGGGPKQFGIDAEIVPDALSRIAAAELAFEGFHLFAGSQNLNPDAIIEAQCKSFDLAMRLGEHAPGPIRRLNLGGGLGVPYFPGEERLSLEAIGENLHHLVARAASEQPQAQLNLELGRYLVAEAGIYVTRVVDRKESRDELFLVCDGGMHHHLAASGNFGQVIRKNYPVAVGNRMDPSATGLASIVGPLCTPLDILASKLPLGHARPGDFIVVFQSGAYGPSASPQAFLGHPSVVEVLV